jgi:subtilisin family serine protease
VLAQQLAEAYDAELRHVYTHALKGFSARISAESASLLVSQNPVIIRYRRNGAVRAPATQIEGGANASGKVPKPSAPDPQWGIYRVGGSFDGTGKHAWIFDTGIDLDNPDLNVSVDTGINCVVGAKDTVDDVAGHGTFIAGIIAGLGNVENVFGVASGAIVHPIKVLHNNLWGSIDNFLCGIDHVMNTFRSVDRRSVNHVINFSIYAQVDGQEDAVEEMEAAIRTAVDEGLRFAVCAGNEAEDASLYSPARMGPESRDIHTVTYMDHNDILSWKGNYGSVVDWAAPGVNITSLKTGGGVSTWSGCSYATPHVAGILLLGNDPVEDGYVVGPDGYAMPAATVNGQAITP